MDKKSRYFLQLAYNGTNYHGWQVQDNAVTIQATIEFALNKIFQQKLGLMGCGRTDTGVHAKDYYAQIDVDKKIENLGKFLFQINSLLPSDISIYKCLEVSPDAHARFDALSRKYEYVISTRKNPFLESFSYFFSRHLDLDKMNAACTYLMGEQDFTSFSKLNTDTFTNNCHISKAVWTKESDIFVFTISANRFLRNMVRSVVGTLLDVGTGKIQVDTVQQIIEKKDRGAAGTSVPAKALFLTEIKYPKEI